MKYDLIICGSGPSGLSAAINASSEGLNTVILEGKMCFGGQAGTSTLIENYLGFSEGVSGRQLTDIALAQAYKFGVEFKAPFNAVHIKQHGKCWKITSDDGDEVEGKAVLIAIGISYKALPAKNVARFIGCGVSYGSPSLSENYANKTVSIVGGANSAGQAALYLAKCNECNVNLIVRASSLEEKMSTYLVSRINKSPNINIAVNTTVEEALGHENLQQIVINAGNIKSTIQTDKMFVLIGAKPKTIWLKPMEMDSSGFILTGLQVSPSAISNFETSLSGVFAVGDVRSDSVKRVAAAIGEGSMAINEIHKYLTSTKFE